MSTTPTNLLSITVAAKRLSICPRTYYRLVQNEQLPPPVKIRGKSLVPETDIEQFIARVLEARHTRNYAA